MLDDLKQIAQWDHEDALGIAEKQWKQLEYTFSVPKIAGEFDNVVHSGMGGSALWALVFRSWPACTKPFEVVQDYSVPSYVNAKTLYIASSYSGNTEETLTGVIEALNKQATVLIITSGGKLAELAQEKNIPLILLPKIDKPRYGMLYGLTALVAALESLNLCAHKDATTELKNTASFLKSEISTWLPTNVTKDNPAKQLALELMGKSAVIYSGQLLSPASHKWKISINENAKNIAWTYTFPEFNHNEFTGWTSHPIEKPYAVIYLHSSYDHARVVQRFKLSDSLLSGRWPSPQNVDAKGESELQQLLWTIALGDFVSIYLAMLNNVSPIDRGDKDIIEKFKKELGSYEL